MRGIDIQPVIQSDLRRVGGQDRGFRANAGASIRKRTWHELRTMAPADPPGLCRTADSGGNAHVAGRRQARLCQPVGIFRHVQENLWQLAPCFRCGDKLNLSHCMDKDRNLLMVIKSLSGFFAQKTGIHHFLQQRTSHAHAMPRARDRPDYGSRVVGHATAAALGSGAGGSGKPFLPRLMSRPRRCIHAVRSRTTEILAIASTNQGDRGRHGDVDPGWRNQSAQSPADRV